jgi:hypothetical protein
MVFGIFGLAFLKTFPPHGPGGGGGARILYWCTISPGFVVVSGNLSGHNLYDSYTR